MFRIGTTLSMCKKLPHQSFQPFQVWDFNFTNETSLNTDQECLLNICQEICSGECPVGLADKKPSKLHQAIWLGSSNNVLCLHLDTKEPKEELKVLD